MTSAVELVSTGTTHHQVHDNRKICTHMGAKGEPQHERENYLNHALKASNRLLSVQHFGRWLHWRMTRVDDEFVIELTRVWMATPALTHPRIESACLANPSSVVGSQRENGFGKKTKVLMFFWFAAGSRGHDWRTRARQAGKKAGRLPHPMNKR